MHKIQYKKNVEEVKETQKNLRQGDCGSEEKKLENQQHFLSLSQNLSLIYNYIYFL